MEVRRRLEELAYRLPCPECGVEPPHMCRTKKGEHAKQIHTKRVGPMWDAFEIGIRRGIRMTQPRKEND